MIGIIGLLVAIAMLAFMAYKGVGALALTIAAGLVVIVTNQMNIWESFSEYYMTGYVNFFKNYFLLFSASALYAKIMEESGAAISIGYKFVDWFGKKRAVLVVFLATCALTYGGISLFVVVFAVTPIIMVLFKEADIPRRLAMGPLLAGAATITMTALPGSPQLTNVIPARFLGTSLTAAPLLGIIASVMMFVMIMVYLTWEEKRLRASGEHFTYIAGTDPLLYEIDRSKLPSAVKSFIPLILIVGIIVFMKDIIVVPTALVVFAMLVASAVALIFFWDRIKDKKVTINSGLGSAVGAIAGPCAVVAFGTLVQNSGAFVDVVAWINEFQMNPYVTGTLATGIISGITGSSSGGLTITMQTFAEQFKASGVNLSILHRLTSIAAGSLDTLPHSSGLFLMFAWLGLTHKEGYRFVFVVSVLIPLITFLILTAGVVMLGF